MTTEQPGSEDYAASASPSGEVQQLFDRLADAISLGDGPAVATMWEVPALVLGDQAAIAVRNLDEVSHFYSAARAQYDARGVVETRAELTRVVWLSERVVTVDVRWPWLDTAGREIGAETDTYTLRRDDEGELKIRVTVVRGTWAPH